VTLNPLTVTLNPGPLSIVGVGVLSLGAGDAGCQSIFIMSYF